MPNTNLPDEGTGGDDVLSFDDGTDAISDLLNPETDLENEDQAQTEGEEGADDDSDELDATDEEEGQDDASDDDGPEDIKGGRFAPDTAKVKLEDGSVVSIADLKRGTLFQADYTRKTQALSEEKKTFETQHQQVSEYARTLNQQRDFLLQAAKQFLPAPPDRALINTDIFGYQNAVADYQEKMGIITQLQQAAQAEKARVEQEQSLARQEAVKREAQKLTEVMPELSKPENYQKFWSETVNTMSEYGFSADELNESANDHRFYKVFRDLMKYRKAIRQAPKVRDDMQKKPVMSGGKRMDPKAKTTRDAQAKSERLRRTGSVNDAVAALMDLDL